MPLYEFKCMKCQKFFELLVMNNDEGTVACPKCKSEAFERILSATNYSMGKSTGGSKSASAQTRSCSGGSCTTYDIPGPA